MARIDVKPDWLHELLSLKSPQENCEIHSSTLKEMFCVDCCKSFCKHCSSSHQHPLLQVKPNNNYLAVRLDDLDQHINCSFIMPYTQSSSSHAFKVVALNQRPPTNKSRIKDGTKCRVCKRVIEKPNEFCCLDCKVEHIMTHGYLSSILRNFATGSSSTGTPS
ncbi:protein RGF1 INDUCIBLE TRANSCRIPTION FACTOR 1-like [Tasmannia lanceolata]|uniref:protein RGF1 INDUCIBLE TRANSCRIPTION FACTOR 1-like n=1 Tax=Tasmannia lanceolata TaxID=3420 RepID=UPI004062E8A5